jgi:prevent-host-death family protein
MEGGVAMGPTTVGIRDLKARLSKYVQQAKSGSVVVITERGHPVALLMPIGATVEQRLEELITAGLLAWSGQKLEPLVPVAVAKGGQTVAGLLLEDRE